ncbi:MAG: hypothetical protein LUI06_08515 [Ruminococcus sp.]|nr:hypothetical protein [Ruminococcus sp.]
MVVTTQISTDLSCTHAPSTIYAKQGDCDSRFVEVSYFVQNESLDLEDVYRSEIRVKKPDGTITVNEGSLGESSVTYPLTDQSLTQSGNASVDFLLYGSSGEVISSVPANLVIIAAAVGDEAVISTDEYQAFVSEFEAYKADSTEQLNALLTATDELSVRLGALSLVKCTQTEYEALTPDSDTLYYVTDAQGGTVTQYLGSVKLTSGSTPSNANLYTAGLSSTVSYAEEE